MRIYLLAAEFLLVFCVLPLAVSVRALGLPLLPPLLAVAAACAIVLREDRSFDRRRFWNGAPAAAAAGDIGRRAFAAMIAIIAIVAALYPDRLLDLPRQRPLVWIAVVVLYPLLSAYPQELVYRAFLIHRYRPIFGDGALAVAASAIAFSFLHVVYLNWLALLITLPAGVLLALTYRRTGSLAAVTLEHAAYGILAFTLGLGGFFFGGRL
jgi:membrane protease YdiL (CAAX protease family)